MAGAAGYPLRGLLAAIHNAAKRGCKKQHDRIVTTTGRLNPVQARGQNSIGTPA